MTSNNASLDDLQRLDALLRPTLSVEEAGRLFGLGRSKAYEEANRYIESGGECGIPAIRFGHTLRCPTALLLDLLGLGRAA